MMQNNLPLQKNTNTNLVTSKKSDYGECISRNKTKRKHTPTQLQKKKPKKTKTKNKITTNLDIANKDISKIAEFYNLYNVVDKEFQKVLNSFSENKEQPHKIPFIKMPNQIPLLTTPQNIPSKKQKINKTKEKRKKIWTMISKVLPIILIH